MERIDLKTVCIGLQTFFFCLLLVQLYRTKKEKQLLKRKMQHNSAQLKKITEENSELGDRIRQLKDFQENLKQAELTTRFQHSRLNDAVLRATPHCPERYRYIRSLDQKGMSSSEIAAILDISTHETEQLLNLLRIAQKN